MQTVLGQGDPDLVSRGSFVQEESDDSHAESIMSPGLSFPAQKNTYSPVYSPWSYIQRLTSCNKMRPGRHTRRSQTSWNDHVVTENRNEGGTGADDLYQETDRRLEPSRVRL